MMIMDEEFQEAQGRGLGERERGVAGCAALEVDND